MSPLEPAPPGPVFHVTPGPVHEHSRDQLPKASEMSYGNVPAASNRPPSNAEKAMSANARSRDGQGKAEDRASHERSAGMTDGAKKRVGGEPGDLTASRDEEIECRGT